MNLTTTFIKAVIVATAAFAVSVAQANPAAIASAVETQVVNATRSANIGLSATAAAAIGAGLAANLPKNGLQQQARELGDEIKNTLDDNLDLRGLTKDERVRGQVVVAEAMALTTEKNDDVIAIFNGDLVNALNSIEGDSSLDNKADHMRKSIQIVEAYVSNLKSGQSVAEAINNATTSTVGHDSKTIAKGCGIQSRSVRN